MFLKVLNIIVTNNIPSNFFKNLIFIFNYMIVILCLIIILIKFINLIF